MNFRKTRRNDANVLASPGINDHQQPAHGPNAKCHESLLARIGFVI
jgi:hypothetical protein